MIRGRIRKLRSNAQRGAAGVIIGLFLAGGAGLALVGLAVDAGGFLSARTQVQAESEQLARYLMQNCITNPASCSNQESVNTLASQFLSRDTSPGVAEPQVMYLCGRSPYLPALPSCVEPYQLSEGCLNPDRAGQSVQFLRAVVTANAPAFFFRSDGKLPGEETNPVFGCYQLGYSVANSAPLYLPLALSGCRYSDSLATTGLSVVKLNRTFYGSNGAPSDTPPCSGHSTHDGVDVQGEVYPKNQFVPMATVVSSGGASSAPLSCTVATQVSVGWGGTELNPADTLCGQALANSTLIRNLGTRYLLPVVTRPNRTLHDSDAQYFTASGQPTVDFVVRGFAQVSVVAYKFRLQQNSLSGFSPPGGWFSYGCDSTSYCMHLRFHEGIVPGTGAGGEIGNDYGTASLTPLP